LISKRYLRKIDTVHSETQSLTNKLNESIEGGDRAQNTLVMPTTPNTMKKINYYISKEADLEPLKGEFIEKIVELEAEIGIMKAANKQDYDELVKLMEAQYESMRAEYKADIIIIRNELLDRFNTIPQIVSAQLPALVDQDLIHESLEKARSELNEHIIKTDGELRNLVIDSFKECKVTILADKEEFMESRIKDMNSKLAVSYK